MRLFAYLLSTLAVSPLLASGAAAAQPSTPAPPSSAATKFDPAVVIAEVRRLIAETYVLPAKRPALDAVLAEGLRSGRYAVREPGRLAERVSADLARVGKDHHLYFRYQPQRFVALTASSDDSKPDPSLLEDAARRANHGIRELRLLPGNVRYLDVASFEWIGPESEAAINAASAFLKGGDAVIIDLRRNGGGAGRAVHQLIGQFLPADKPMISFQSGTETSPPLTSLDGLSTMIGKPLYVLTSRTTGSAAEEFTGHVAGYKLGEIVGDRTSGAAYMNRLFPIAPGFILSVSAHRPVLASTGGDWEGTGIAPTIAVPVESALDTAHIHAIRKLAAANDGAKRAELTALAESLQAIRSPAKPAAAPAAYTGTYGDRRILIEGGKLFYQNGEEPRRQLVALGGHSFTFADDPASRLTFQASGSRITAFDQGPAAGPAEARYDRTR